MTDQDGDDAGSTPGPVQELIAQLHGAAERLAGLTGLSGLASSLTGMPSLPRPAALSAAQLAAVRSTIAAQRRSIDAMQAQLGAFDEQLSVMEKILEPLTEWTNRWADLEKTVMNLRPGTDRPG